MANWTQQELEELLAKMTQKAMTDAEFRKEVLEDATAALEKLAGKPLPEGSSLKCIEKDPNYQTTLVLPDLVDEEKIDDEALSNVAGGIGVALIVSYCFHALAAGPDVGVCYAKLCAADACGAFYDRKAGPCAAQLCGRHAQSERKDDCAAYACANYD